MNKEMICPVCNKGCTIDPYIHKGCLKFVNEVRKELSLFSARSVFELLPAKSWENDEARKAYYLGVRETENEWHKLIFSLIEKRRLK